MLNLTLRLRGKRGRRGGGVVVRAAASQKEVMGSIPGLRPFLNAVCMFSLCLEILQLLPTTRTSCV